MPAQDAYDAEEARIRLQRWYAAKVPDATAVEVGELSAPGETGHSSETIMFDASWTIAGERSTGSFVLRTRPTGHTVFPTYDLGLQYEVMRRIGDAAPAIPLPPLRWMEPSPDPLGREFFVMERVEGQVPPDNLPYTMQGWLLDAAPDDQRRLQLSSLDVLADLHAVDWRAAGLDILDRPRLGRTGLDQQLGFYRSFLEWGRMGRAQPTLDRTAAWLDAHRPDPEPEAVLNWGDARIGNMIYRDFIPVAVLDWEMATLGPREVDLAWMLLFQHFFSTHLGVPDLPGFVSRAEAVAHYESRARCSVDDLDWYLMWAAHRYAVVMMRIVQAAQLAGNDIGFDEHDNVAVTMLEALESEIG